LKTILIDDYINNDPTALSAITDFTTNKLIIKGNTGIGGTSAVLAITDQTVIIISPYLGMIQDKENQNLKENKLFIYQNSEASWNDVSNFLTDNLQFILNTTPDQILKLKNTNNYLYAKIKKIPLFIDESHIAAEADYRKSLAIFNHEVFNNWENYFTLSTATPVYNNVDIPSYIKENLEVIRIQKKDQAPKDITIYNHRFHQEWVLKELALGNKVVLFSNDENIYKNFLQFDDIQTQVLVGVHLEKKVATFKDADVLNLTNKLDLEKDLYILSTKYITGFDIPFDASVAIITNEKSHTDTRYINEIVQAYGRVRNRVINAAIFYTRKDFIEPISDMAFINAFNKALSNPTPDQLTDGIVNHTLVLNDLLPVKLRQQTYNSVESFSDNLKQYEFNPTIKYIEECVVIPSGITLSDMVQNLRTRDNIELKKFADYVFTNINGDNDDYYGFGERLLIIYAAAYIAKTCENNWLDGRISNVSRYGHLVTILKTFIDVNTMHVIEVARLHQNASKWEKIIDPHPVPNKLDEITRFHVSQRLLTTAQKGGALCKSFSYINQPNSTFEHALFLINTFHVINLVANDEVNVDTLQIMEINAVLSKIIREDYLSGICKVADLKMNEAVKKIEAGDENLNSQMYNRPIKTYFKHTFEKVVRNLSFPPTPEQEIGIRIKLDKNIHSLGRTKEDGAKENIRFKLNSINFGFDKQKEYHRLYLLGMASLHIAGHMAGFRSSKKSHREYNVVTKVPKVLRYNYTPYHVVEVDVRSANAQFIDKLFDTSIAMSVYQNLMIAYGVTRDEAKVLYNKTLNNTKLPFAKALEVYQNAGYDEIAANAIAVRTTSSKIYFDMCEAEEEIIQKYRAASRVQNAIRCHDALLMLAISHNQSNLPAIVDGIEFGVRMY
jgi:hypothetical protein